jgi:hypothetical protein
MNLEQQLLDLKSKGEQLGRLKVENSTKLSMLEHEKTKLLEECNQLGLQSDKIEETLANEEATLQLEMTELETKINGILEEISKI